MATRLEKRNRCKLVAMFLLNFFYFWVEFVVGYITGSMALVADSFHMLSDVIALIIAYIAVRISSKKWSKNTYGWARAEVLGALVNAVFLLALCFTIIVDAIQRIITPQSLENPELILIVGTIGLLMNLAGLCIFHEHNHGHSHGHGYGGHSHGHGHSHNHTTNTTNRSHRKSGLTHSNRLTRMVSNMEPEQDESPESSYTLVPEAEALTSPSVTLYDDDTTTTDTASNDATAVGNVRNQNQPQGNKQKTGNAQQMNMKGVFLHLFADTMGSVVVVVSALVVLYADWEYEIYLDPAMSLVMVSLILISLYPLIIESSLILLQGIPSHIDINELEEKLRKDVEGLEGIHELHVWQLAGNKIVATAHIRCRSLNEYFHIAHKVKAIFHHAGIHSTTIQPEFSDQSSQSIAASDKCMLSCSALAIDKDCVDDTCCPPPAPPSSQPPRPPLKQN